MMFGLVVARTADPALEAGLEQLSGSSAADTSHQRAASLGMPLRSGTKRLEEQPDAASPSSVSSTTKSSAPAIASRTTPEAGFPVVDHRYGAWHAHGRSGRAARVIRTRRRWSGWPSARPPSTALPTDPTFSRAEATRFYIALGFQAPGAWRNPEAEPLIGARGETASATPSSKIARHVPLLFLTDSLALPVLSANGQGTHHARRARSWQHALSRPQGSRSRHQSAGALRKPGHQPVRRWLGHARGRIRRAAEAGHDPDARCHRSRR